MDQVSTTDYLNVAVGVQRGLSRWTAMDGGNTKEGRLDFSEFAWFSLVFCY
ncbi:hypothetical protein [Vibrio echinoideorum]|uniref:hypothetical protein n=1 Tax=Vibrio echinoideorum TaxID=2100116 RepID=UPI0014369D9A|nr:hypothetical protein [Vibrio echinoideorum]